VIDRYSIYYTFKIIPWVKFSTYMRMKGEKSTPKFPMGMISLKGLRRGSVISITKAKKEPEPVLTTPRMGNSEAIRDIIILTKTRMNIT
jgi:hypothetical protein